MFSKKIVLSILLLAFFAHSSTQLSISEAAKDNIKRKIAEVINLFKEEASCKDPKWCEGFKVDACESPLTNATACCLYCVKSGKYAANAWDSRNFKLFYCLFICWFCLVVGKVAVKTTTVPTTTIHNDDADKITLPDTTTDDEEDKITLPEVSTDDVVEVTTIESVPVKTKKVAVTTVAPVVADVKKTKGKEVAKPRVLSEMLLEVDSTDPNEIIVFKKSFERVPKECPKEVGLIGCTIVEKCHSNSDCSKLERCCLKNCVRTCISI